MRKKILFQHNVPKINLLINAYRFEKDELFFQFTFFLFFYLMLFLDWFMKFNYREYLHLNLNWMTIHILEV